MIDVLLQANPSTQNFSMFQLIPFFSGGLIGALATIIYNRISNRIQIMKCHYVDDDVIAKVPVMTNHGEQQNMHAKEFLLTNTTNKDIVRFKIIFEFDAQSKIIKYVTWSKIGKTTYEIEMIKDNECSFTITNFNRGDTCKFNFDIANLSKDVYNITESECIGFKIVTKDKRQPHKKNHGKIVKKEDIQ